MNNNFTVIETRLEEDGIVRHVVLAPGGSVVVREDDAGNLSGRIRSGYVATDEEGEETLDRAFEAVRQLRQGPDSAKEIEMDRFRDFLDS
ncbi:MAG TPA: hypothetical protein VGQ41_24285 [Pyrinomonadaceae bacterium]|jgi:hypothetical protein|nr:hypothetical protein [Pyrinomonadaceae bacterium]